MVDFIKLQPLDNKSFENHIIENRIVDLTMSLDRLTGEIKEYPKVGRLSNLEVRINPIYSHISGSLHKFENIQTLKENHNYNDFSYYQLANQIPVLLEKFELENKNSLSFLEFGFNLNLGFNPQKFVDNNLLMYDYKSHNKDLKTRADYKEFIKTDYSLKIYNKSKHYKLNSNILRIEIKITKKRFLRKLNIFTLEDLLSKDNLFTVFKILFEEFDKVAIIDDWNNIEIPQKDLDKLNKYTNPNYWIRLKENNNSYKVQARLKKDFCNIVRKYKLDTIKKDLQHKLDYKFWELINQNCEEKYLPKDVA